MANFDIPLPIQGIHNGLPVENQPPSTSGDMDNVRPRDVLESRIRIGQRPGLKKAYSQQIGGNEVGIVDMCEVTLFGE